LTPPKNFEKRITKKLDKNKINYKTVTNNIQKNQEKLKKWKKKLG